MPQYQWIRQQSGADCAAASLAIVAKHYGRTFKISRLREVIGTAKGGTTLLGLKQGAESLGFQAKVLKINPEQCDRFIEKFSPPAIIYWQGYHFVVLYGQENDQYIVSDPGIGIRYLSRSELLDGWQGGFTLLLSPHLFWFHAQPNDAVDPWGNVLQRLYPHRWTVLSLILLGICLGASVLIFPIFLQIVIDRVIQPNPTQPLFNLLIMFAVWQTLSSGLTWGQLWLATRFSQTLQTSLKLDFTEQILQLPLSYHEARYDSVVRGVLRDIQAISQSLNQIVVTLPHQTFSGLAVIVVLTVYHPAIALASTGVALSVTLITIGLHPTVRQASYRSAITTGSNLFLLSEVFRNALTLKTTAATPHLSPEIHDRLHQETRANRDNAQVINLNQTLSHWVLGIGSLVLLVFAALLYQQQRLSLGQLVAVYSLNWILLSAVQAGVDFWLNFTQVQTAAQLLDELFDCIPENLEDGCKPWINVSPQADISCQGLQYRYPGRLPLLADLSLTLPGGAAIALIGYSGCGKSTLAKLLTRLYPVSAGVIQLGDRPLEDFPLDCLRRQVVLVPQEAEFLTRSIADNLRLAQPDATLDDIQTACKIAAAHEFIQSFPEQYDTILGTFSANLSGGQKQRIAIARAILMNPPILILDEATANLDPPTEAKVMDQLLAQRSGKTTLLISHRPNVIERAEWVLWIDQGTARFNGKLTHFREQSLAHLEFLNP
jgi:ATP-binding cassette subfamily C protein